MSVEKQEENDNVSYTGIRKSRIIIKVQRAIDRVNMCVINKFKNRIRTIVIP